MNQLLYGTNMHGPKSLEGSDHICQCILHCMAKIKYKL